VNAQNQVSSNLDKTAAVPGFRDVVSSIVNIPIDQNSQESLRRFRASSISGIKTNKPTASASPSSA
ncbi:hypothetical protein L7A47_35300, partial [Achromobacter xylosoxidans]|uniref:hypothetical protein n=1 Tax=Alcaligenes xylosoxydans xylosoxydans TaxID=85698 RepID=UPI001F0E6AF8